MPFRMRAYLIILCSKCGFPILCQSKHKTATCKKCNKTHTIKSAKIIYSTNDKYIATQVLKKTKANKMPTKKPQFFTYNPE